MDLLDPATAKLQYISDNVRGRQATLATARKRDDAISAEFIAALDYGNKSDVRRMKLGVRN